jgi:CRP-like cAMP-binding protein
VAVARSAPVARVAGVLRESPYLRGLPAPWLRRLSAAATRLALPAGAQLETEQAAPEGPCLYLVLAGEVSVWSPSAPDGVAEIVGEEGPGAMFGSRAITGEEDVPVFRAATPVDACVWRAADLQRLFDDVDGLRRQLDVRLSARRREPELVLLLRRTPLFAHVSQPLIRWLVRASTLRS